MDVPQYENKDSNNYETKRSGGMETAALVLGILGLATGCCVYTSIICGALAVIFALLSKGGEKTMSSKGKIGLILGIAGIIMGILLLTSAIAFVLLQYGSFEQYMKEYFDMFEMDFSSYPSYL